MSRGAGVGGRKGCFFTLEKSLRDHVKETRLDLLADRSTPRRMKILSSSSSVTSIEVVEWNVAAFIRRLDGRQ